MPSLRSLFALAVMALLLVGTFHTLRDDLTCRAAAEQASMAAMAEIWQTYQMPMPPPGARLVRFPVKPPPAGFFGGVMKSCGGSAPPSSGA